MGSAVIRTLFCVAGVACLVLAVLAGSSSGNEIVQVEWVGVSMLFMLAQILIKIEERLKGD